jgi:predicted choloylglycine hydrolase
MKYTLQIIGAFNVVQKRKISFSDYCAKKVFQTKKCKFLKKNCPQKFSDEKTTNKIFQKLLLDIINVE